jgi:hypothetical protein
MEFSTLVQTVGLPVAMLVVALVTVLRYFIDGKVVPRWVYDVHIRERDTIIERQTQEIREYRELALRGTSATELGAKVLQEAVGSRDK